MSPVEEPASDHPDVHPVPAHPAGGPGRRRGAQPPAAGPGRLRPPRRARHLQLAAAGLPVLRNVERIVREEMDAIGAQEVHFPALLPREPYEATGRWTEYGDNLFRLKDRKGGDYLLGPTHEEMFTLLVKDIVSSYKSLPLALYQIQTKYRDEARPRAGILRGREFVMKDSYSFDLDDAGLAASYQRHRDAYIRIFDRLGLRYVIVAAMSGAMGGSASEEFLADAEVGEDTYVRSLELRLRGQRRGGRTSRPRPSRRRVAPAGARRGHPRHADHRDPGRRPERARSRGPTGRGRPRDTLKNVLVHAAAPRRHAASRWPSACPATARSTPSGWRRRSRRPRWRRSPRTHFAANPALVKGYIGPGRAGRRAGQPDPLPARPADRCRAPAWVTGADQPGRHVIGLVAGRDFTADGTIEAAEIRDGDPCPDGRARAAQLARGIEMGHIFQLGRKYADALDLQGARRERQAGHRHHGLLRRRGVPGGRGDRRELPRRAGSDLAAGDRPGRRARGDRRQGVRRSPRPAETIAGGLDAAGDPGDARRPERLGRGQVDRRRADRGADHLVVGRGVADGLVELRDRATGDKREVSLAEVAERPAVVVPGSIPQPVGVDRLA